TLNNGYRQSRCAACRQEIVAQGGDAAHAHVADYGQPALGQRLPFWRLAIRRMGGDQNYTARYTAMRQGQAQRCTDGQSGRDATDAVYRNASLPQPGHFFPASAEDERVSAFQTRDSMALARIARHKAQDECLRR